MYFIIYIFYNDVFIFFNFSIESHSDLVKLLDDLFRFMLSIGKSVIFSINCSKFPFLPLGGLNLLEFETIRLRIPCLKRTLRVLIFCRMIVYH